MSVTPFAISVLLILAVVVEMLACAGLVVMRTTMQRLHFVGPATCVGPWLVAGAVMLGTHATGNQAGKAVLIALLLSLFAGVLSHETARAATAHDCGDT